MMKWLDITFIDIQLSLAFWEEYRSISICKSICKAKYLAYLILAKVSDEHI